MYIKQVPDRADVRFRDGLTDGRIHARTSISGPSYTIAPKGATKFTYGEKVPPHLTDSEHDFCRDQNPMGFRIFPSPKLFVGIWTRNLTNFSWLYLREYCELNTKIYDGFVS